MENIKEICGFPIKKENEFIAIHSDCNFPLQSLECYNLYLAIEKTILKGNEIKFPLNLKKWKEIIKPTPENLNEFFSMKGIMKFIQQYYPQLNNTITFYKPEIYYTRGNNLPTLALHFYQFNYEGKLNIKNEDELTAKCMIHTKDIDFTSERVHALEKYNIDWFKHIPLLPMEQIKFDEAGNVMEFQHQKLNTQDTYQNE